MAIIGSDGVLAPGKLRWLRAAGWMVVLAAAVVIAFNAIARATLWLLAATRGTDLAVAPAVDRLVAACVGAMAIVALYGVAVRFGERRRVSELSLRHLAPDLLLGVLVGAALMAVIVAALWLGRWVVITPRPVEAIAIALRDSIRSGVVEELLLRLVIFRLLWRAFGVWPALAVSASLFGLLHLSNPNSSLLAAVALIAGEGIGIGLYLITGRIWAAMGMHAAWNFTQGWLFGAAVSGTTDIAGGPLALRPMPGVPDLLSGGGFGPEASLAALIVSLAASAAFLLRAWKLGRFVAADDPGETP